MVNCRARNALRSASIDPMTNDSSTKSIKPDPKPAAPPQKSSLATLRGLLPFLAPYKRQFLLAGIALLIAAGATLAIPYAFRQMIDLGFGGADKTGSKSIEHVDFYFLALFGVASVLAIAASAASMSA